MTEPSAADLSRQAVDHVLAALTATSHRGVVVDSPPGAGKTTLVVDAAHSLIRPRHPCMIVAQTNAQVDDLAIRYPLTVESIDVRSAEGLRLMARHRAALSPLVLLDGVFFSHGRLPRRKLHKTLAGLYGESAVRSTRKAG